MDALRKGDAFIPELSLVAEADGKIVGHIMFTKAMVNGKTVLALAPLSVLPEYQRKGIGKALIQEGHRIAKKLGYTLRRFGKRKILSKGRIFPCRGFWDKSAIRCTRENFMAYMINKTDAKIHGTIKYAPEFGIE